ALPETQNVYEVRQDFAVSIANTFNQLGILDLHKSRGAFAAYWDALETDIKSIAASGWNAELIPADAILQSQFPEVLDELAKNEARRDELDALFNEVNELDEDEYEEDNYEVFPKEALNELKVDVKEANATIRQCKKDIKALNIRIKANAQPSLNDDVTSSAVERSQLESQLEKLQHQQTQAETKKTN